MVSPVIGKDVCPGREPDCLKPAGTGVKVSVRIYDSKSLEDRAKEGRGSECRHSGTVEGISARMCVLLCFIMPLLGNRYVRSRGVIVILERAKGDAPTIRDRQRPNLTLSPLR